MTSVTPPGPDTFAFEQPRDRTLPLLDDATPTFLGVPPARTPADLEGAGAAIIGIPSASGEPPHAADLVPRHLRVASAKFRGGFLPEMDLDPLAALNVVDYGDVVVDPGDVSGSIERSRQTVAEVVAAGAIPITIGGNAPVAGYAPLRAVAEATDGPLGVINLDEYGDNLDEYLGERMHGSTWVARALELSGVDAGRWVQVGMRGPGNVRDQFRWFRERGATLFTSREYGLFGTQQIVREAIDAASEGAAATFLAIDWSVIDSSSAPDWVYPDPLGLTSNDILHLSFEVGRSMTPLAGYALMSLPAWSRPPLWLASWSILYVLAGICAREGLHA